MTDDDHGFVFSSREGELGERERERERHRVGGRDRGCMSNAKRGTHELYEALLSAELREHQQQLQTNTATQCFLFNCFWPQDL